MKNVKYPKLPMVAQE